MGSPEDDIGDGNLLRFNFSAGEKWAVEYSNARADRKHKKRSTKKEELPLYGSLLLKALGDFNLRDSAGQVSCIVGAVKQGLLELAERTVQSIDFVADWRTEMDGDDGRDLRICVDFL